MPEESPLEKLVVESSKEIERIIYEVLKDYIALDKERKEVLFLDKARELTLEKKIIALLLGYKAMELLGWQVESNLSPKEIASKIGANYNTVRVVIPTLNRRGLISKVGRGKYCIELSRIMEIASLLREE